MTMTSVNNGEPYYLKVDISKAGESTVSINNYIKMRVFDNGKVLPVKWFDQNVVMNVNGMIPFIEGSIGEFSTDDNDNIVMAPDAVHRDWQGTAANTRDGGWADYILTDQMFTEEGAFSGFIGLMDGNGRRLTSINIWFRVLGDNLVFGLTRKYYSDKIEKFIKQMQAKGDKAIDDLYQKYNTEVRLHEGALQESTQSLQLLSTQAASILSKLETNDVVTISKYNQDKQADRNMLQTALSKINTSIEGFPTADDLKNTYPQGKNGIFMAMDTGHGFVWWNNSWTDCGQLMTMRDTGQAVYKPYVDHLPLKDHPDSENHPGDASWWAFNKIYPAGYVSYVSLEITGDDDQKAIVGLVDKDTNKVMALEEANGHGKLIINFNKVMESSFYILIKATNFKFTNEENGIDYTVWQIASGDTGYDYVHLGQDMNPKWLKGNYTPYLDVAYISISDQLNKLRDNQFYGTNSSELDFNKYLSKGGYFFGVDASSTDKLQHAPNNDTWGNYSLIVLPINPAFYVQIATTYSAEHGKSVSLRFVGLKADGSFDDSTPLINQWLPLSNGTAPLQGSNSSELDFNKYLSKGGYFFGVDASSTDKLQHAPNGDTWGYYSLIVLPINPAFYVQIATTYSAEHGKCFAIRYVGKNDDGTFNTSNPPLNEWIIIYHENLSHNRMFIAGDSITAGYPYEDNTHIAYANEISRSLKFDVTRGARNGAGWLYNNGIDGMKIVEQTNFSEYDVAMFAFGTNDFGNDQPLGQMGDIYPDQKTFYGAVTYAVRKIYESNPKIILILSTPLLRVDYGDESTQYALNAKNKAGFTLNQYIEAEIEICKKYNISYIDNRISPINVLSAPSLLVDRLHPNEDGYHVLGSYLTSKVASIIRPYVE